MIKAKRTNGMEQPRSDHAYPWVAAEAERVAVVEDDAVLDVDAVDKGPCEGGAVGHWWERGQAR